ncbi:MAG: stage II sporulation protein R [Bacilli bacterium]|nr:stage II sporulation protein R [Bacilli bacterium]
MKKIIIVFSIIFLFVYLTNVKGKEVVVPKEAIRLRVIANSNSEYDQKIKMKLSIEIEEEITKLLKDTKNIAEARKIIKNNLQVLNMKVSEILKKEGYKDTYKLTFGNAFFPEKKYKGIIYEKGYYETLLITLGKGNGNNWWCVLFPPLCLMEANENETGEVEYKFFVKELLEKYL